MLPCEHAAFGGWRIKCVAFCLLALMNVVAVGKDHACVFGIVVLSTQDAERRLRDIDAAWQAKQEAADRSWVNRMQVG